MSIARYYVQNLLTKINQDIKNSLLFIKTKQELHNLALSKYPYIGIGFFVMISISSMFYCFWCCKNDTNDGVSMKKLVSSKEDNNINQLIQSPENLPDLNEPIEEDEDEEKEYEKVDEKGDDKEEEVDTRKNDGRDVAPILAGVAALTAAGIGSALLAEELIKGPTQPDITESTPAISSDAAPISTSTSSAAPQPSTEERLSDLSDASTTNRNSQRKFQRRFLPGNSVSSVHSTSSSQSAPVISPLAVEHALERSVSRIPHEVGLPDPKSGYLRKLGHSGWGFTDRYFTLVRGVLTNYIDESQSRESDTIANREDKSIKLLGYHIQVQAEQFQFILEGPANKRLLIEVRKDSRKKIEFALWTKALTEHIDYANGYFNQIEDSNTSVKRRKSGSSTMST